MMKILYFDAAGLNCTPSMIGRTSSTLLCEAPSSSVTSMDLPSAICRQLSHAPQGSTPFGVGQLMAFAKMRESVVLPMPREPTKR